MAYWFALYLPTGVGINSATVQTDSGTLLASGIQPAGTATAAWEKSGVTTGLIITPYLQNGVSVSRWVINAGGNVYYQYTNVCSIGYDSSVSTVQIRLEVTGTPTTTYYAYLAYNANGGSGAPGTHLVSGNTQSFSAQISRTVPVRDGYTFAGWWLYNEPSYGTFPAGGLVTITGTEGSPSSTPHTLYAQWTKKTSGGGAYIGPEFSHYFPYVWNGSRYVKSVPYVWSNGWKKGT